jgi:hypothetical protein
MRLSFQHCKTSVRKEKSFLRRPLRHMRDSSAQTARFFSAQQPLVGQGLVIIETSQSHSDTPHSVGALRMSDQPRRRDLYLTKHNTHKRQTSMPPVGFEPAIPGSDRLQTYALGRAATGIGKESTVPSAYDAGGGGSQNLYELLGDSLNPVANQTTILSLSNPQRSHYAYARDTVDFSAIAILKVFSSLRWVLFK